MAEKVKCELKGCIRRAVLNGLCSDHAFERAFSRIPVPLVDVPIPEILDRSIVERMSPRAAVAAALRTSGRAMSLRELQAELGGSFTSSRITAALEQLIDRRMVEVSAQEGIGLNGRPVTRYELAGVRS